MVAGVRRLDDTLDNAAGYGRERAQWVIGATFRANGLADDDAPLCAADPVQ